MSEPDDIVQNANLPVDLLQRRQRLSHGHAVFRYWKGGRPLWDRQVSAGSDATFPIVTDAHIDGYPVQPRGRCGLTSERRAVLERAHKGLLNDIVGVLPYVSRGQGMQPRTRTFVSPHQLIAPGIAFARRHKTVPHTWFLQPR
jgi:hypothetical protein